ncbi:hypothetical protein PBRA_002817 [Plasmodiophora brassicae]|nr:hypothetical protein PBRA_002817 [Plasmodiophora brassicae]
MSATVRRNMLRCALLNIVIFSGSILLTSQIVMPVIRAIIGDSSTATFLGLLLDRLYRIFWIWPVYCLSFLFNTVWYQSIADSAFIISARKPSRRRASVSDWVAAMAEEVYRFALLGCFVAQVAMLSLLPLIGSLAWNVLMTWLYSFYMWEYKWALQGWTMDQRVAFFQRRWAYFFGFGAPATLLSVVWPTFISYGVFAFLFPCFIILAIASRPQPHVGFAAETGIPIFASSMVLSGKLASLCRPAPRSRTRDHED